MKTFCTASIAAALALASLSQVVLARDTADAGLHADLARHDAARPGATAQGKASFYSSRLKGRRTASGEPYDPGALTAAHRTLPLGTRVRVVNPKNDRSVIVTVNDRGPVPKGRMLDVSGAAADALDMKKAGVTRVRTEIVGPSIDANPP